MNLPRALLLAATVVGVSRVQAAIRPSFNLETCAWNATHIVVVSDADKGGDNRTVVESWRGDLKPGDTISIPALLRGSRRVETPFLIDKDSPPKFVTGARMILFLVKARRVEKDDAERGNEWVGADFFGSMATSVVWVEKDETYAMIQVMNPGETLLVPQGEPEEKIKARTRAVLSAQDSLRATESIVDLAKRAEEIDARMPALPYCAQQEALGRIRRCGETALPVLRKMLESKSRRELGSDAVESIAAILGDKAGPELTAILQGELGFWRTTGPGLKSGWWNDFITRTDVDTLRNKYSIVYAALYSLRAHRFAGCKETVTAFRELWATLPQLSEVGNDQIGEECRNVLRELPQSTSSER